MTIGIYKITNKCNGKLYIGKSSNIEERFKKHILDLNNNRGHNNHFQNAWNKYGECNFKFEIIHELESDEETDYWEIHYIAKFNTTNSDNGYNFTHGGEGGKLSERMKIQQRKASQFKNSDLNEEIVRRIKIAIYCLMNRHEVSKMFDVPYGVVKSISEGKNYYYVSEELNEQIKCLKRKIIDERNVEIFKLYEDGLRIVDICHKLNLSKRVVEHVIYDANKHTDKMNEYEKKYSNIYEEVIKLHKEGVINHHIAKQLKISPSTVTRYLKKYASTEVNE